MEHYVNNQVPLFHDGFMTFENTKSDKKPPVNALLLPLSDTPDTQTLERQNNIKSVETTQCSELGS